MTLPELGLQFIYGRLAWAVVVAALLSSFGRQWRAPALAKLLGAALAVMCLPGAASPAYWLILAFQYPSALLFAACALRLAERAQGLPASRLLAPWLALLLVAGGTLLYLDTFGVTALGLYYTMFDQRIAGALAVGGALACAVAIARAGTARLGGPFAALLLALVLFSVLRLPTGNLLDALLDPLLCVWALGALAAALVRRRPATASEPAPASMAAGMPAAEPVSFMKESIGGK